MTAYEQRSYTGGAADTLLNADLTSGGLSFSVTPGTGAGYPDGTQGPFHVFIDYDNSKIEKIRCSGRINDTFTVAATGGGRGQDGTTAQAHTANAKVRHGLTATDIQEANRAAANTVGLVTTKGDLLAGTGANTLARVAAGANGTIPIYDSTQPSGLRAGTNPFLQQPFAQAYRTSSLGVPNSTWTVVPWAGLTVQQPPVGTFALAGTSSERITVPRTGYYRVSAKGAWATASGGRAIRLCKNSAGSATTNILSEVTGTAGSVDATYGDLSPVLYDIVSLTSGDYVETYLWQSSGASLGSGFSGGVGVVTTLELIT